MDAENLKDYGIDYGKGLSRCMDDAGFYRRLLSMFLEDDSFARAKEAFGQKDYKQLFSCTHELKGACGNAAMTGLYEAVCPLVELLRGGSKDDEAIAGQFAEVEAAYELARKGVTLFIG